MTLAPGSRLGPYEIVSAIGAGGMGEVFRARDPKLNRDVAIKVLPAALAEDRERVARFRREAQLLAALHHPNVASVFGLEESNGTVALVMELVEGEDLAQRLARGALPVDEAVAIARQIAEGLEAAHEKGIVHRDLKPANVKLAPDGAVKILDFGLAKALEGDDAAASSAPSMTHSPTMSRHMTEAGMILGTAAYMSPEQARGRPADRRADVWAFGVVLWEMLTGERLFAGETVSDVLAAVLRQEVDARTLPAATPPHVRRLLARCLERDPKQRLRDIGEARIALDRPDAPPAPAPAAAPAPARRRVLGAVAVLLLVAAAVLATRLVSLASRPRIVLQAAIPPPEGTAFHLDAASPGAAVLSPDGSTLAFCAHDAKGTARLYVRPLAAGAARLLEKTEDARYPFWSPDGRTIGFFTADELKTVEARGEPPVTLCRTEDGKGGTWNAAGVIVFAPRADGTLSKVPASGGEPVAITKFDAARGDDSHRHPRFLPDGRHFLYLARSNGRVAGGNAVVVGSLDGGPEKLLLRSSSAAEYADGRLFFLRDGTLMARSFDPARLAFRGEPFPVAERVLEPGRATAVAAFTVSENGTLAYMARRGAALPGLELVGRDGKVTGTMGEPAEYFEAVLAPDGQGAVASVVGSRGGEWDLWLLDGVRKVQTRFTFDGATAKWSVFTPDGRAVIYASNRRGHLDVYRKPVGGGGDELLVASDEEKRPMAISSDGRWLAYGSQSKETAEDVWILDLASRGAKPRPIMKTKYNEFPYALSPDGRFLVYGSDESGRYQVYVTTFPEPGRKWQLSTIESAYASWRRDGREIVFEDGLGMLQAVDVATKGDELLVGSARPLFKVPEGLSAQGQNFSASPDHQRFLLRNRHQETDPLLTLVVNWPAARGAR